MAKLSAAQLAAQKLAEEKVDFLTDMAGAGLDNIGADDVTIPFIKILQPLSPQVDESNEEEYVKGAKPGLFFNSVTKHIYGKEIQVIPLRFQKVWLEWLPKRGGLVGRHEPGTIEVDKTDFTEWKNEAGNVIVEYYSFYVLIMDHIDEGPAVMSMSSTGIKHAKNWNSQIIMTRLPDGEQAPYFSSVWKLLIGKYPSPDGSYYQVGKNSTNITRERFITKSDFEDAVLPTYEKVRQIESADYKLLEAPEAEVADDAGDEKVPY